MSTRDTYMPGAAAGAQVRREADHWTLVLARELNHPPEAVWKALTDPASLRQWAPFDVDRSLACPGPVTLSTVGTPTPQASQSQVTRAEKPRLLEYTWGDKPLRWELEPFDGGTRLTLWHQIDRGFISMGAAGWHICLDVLGHLVAGTPLGRIVGGEAMRFGWPRLNAEYAQLFGVKAARWEPPGSPS
jgi:uncharacterized protein YndB with AHSA1/START domain